jgi:hypothetical protein
MPFAVVFLPRGTGSIVKDESSEGVAMREGEAFDPTRVQIEKAIRALEFVARRMERQLFSSEDERAKWMHDLQVIRRMNNLKSVAAQYVGADETIVFEHEIVFCPNGHANDMAVDAGAGLELPLLPLNLIRGNRLVMTEHDRSQRSLYQDLLKVPWTNVKCLKKAKGTSVQSVHHEKITKGNNTASLFVSQLARHFGRISRVIEGRGFAFAEDETLGRSVWLHVSHAPKGYVFRVGNRVSYVAVDVPKGLQGRDIQPA